MNVTKDLMQNINSKTIMKKPKHWTGKITLSRSIQKDHLKAIKRSKDIDSDEEHCDLSKSTKEDEE